MDDRTTVLRNRLVDAFMAEFAQCPEVVRQWGPGFDIQLLRLLRSVAALFLSRWLHAENARRCEAAKAEGFRVERHPKIRVLTVFGWVETVSTYLRRASDNAGKRPLNEHYGVSGTRSTLAVQRALTDFGMERSFADASSAFFEHYGVEVGATTVQNITERHAHRIRDELDSWYEEAPEPAREHRAERMILAMDGCALRVTERKPAGCLGRTDVPKHTPVRVDRWVDVRLAKARRDGDVTGTFVCKHDSFDAVLQSLQGAARLRGRTEQTELVFLGDGGNGLMEAALRYFPTAQFVLDRCHLRQHLYRVVAHIGTHDHAVKQLVDIFDAVLGQGNAWWVILQLRPFVPASKAGQPVEPCPVANFIEYLERFANCIHYEEYQRRGWPIGSGEIESAHRQVSQARLKLPGAAWTTANLNAMAATRAARESGLWERCWQNAA